MVRGRPVRSTLKRWALKICGTRQQSARVRVSPWQYTDGGKAFLQTFLDRYTPKYVIVGPMERAYYPPAGLAKFERMVGDGRLRIAYQNPGVTIYEVTEK